MLPPHAPFPRVSPSPTPVAESPWSAEVNGVVDAERLLVRICSESRRHRPLPRREFASEAAAGMQHRFCESPASLPSLLLLLLSRLASQRYLLYLRCIFQVHPHPAASSRQSAVPVVSRGLHTLDTSNPDLFCTGTRWSSIVSLPQAPNQLRRPPSPMSSVSQRHSSTRSSRDL
jgi:hypothetical protein